MRVHAVSLESVQESRQALEHFRALKAQDRLDVREIEGVCRAIDSEFSDPSRLSPGFARDAVEVLCEVATMPEERWRRHGQRIIFESIAERLGDSFEPVNVSIYDRIFAQIIEHCRGCRGAEDLDRELRRFNLRSEEDLLTRKNRASSGRPVADAFRNAVKQAFVLSRVTLGADVAVTSVIIQCLEAAFPNAGITLIGPAALQDLYENAGSFRTLHAPYERRGTLLDRLGRWPSLVRAIDNDRRDLAPDEYIIVDPDSRLTQLGLLPVTEQQDRYFFFESRSYVKTGNERLGQLASAWCSDVFGLESNAYPFVRLSPKDLDFGRRCCEWLRAQGTSGIVAFNFGAGANESKQVSIEFETQLVLQALDRGYGVVLDKGIGAECDRADVIVGHVKAAGKHISQLNALTGASAPGDLPQRTQGLVWEGGVGPFSGLIASADLYVGYDSAFQHIAAALGVPVVDLFTCPENDRFVDRWTPHSRAPVTVVRVGSPSGASMKNAAETARQVLLDCLK